MWRHRQQESQQRQAHYLQKSDTSPSPDSRWSARTTLTNDRPISPQHRGVPLIGQHRSSGGTALYILSQTNHPPHLLPRRQFSTPYKEPFSYPLPQPAGVWVKGDRLLVRTITYGHCFPNNSSCEFLKLHRSVWRTFMKPHPKVGRTLCCSKQILDLFVVPLCLHPAEKLTIK